MNENKLELVETMELVEELRRRFDGACILLHRTGGGGKEHELHYHHKGPAALVIGMLEIQKRGLLNGLVAEETGESD